MEKRQIQSGRRYFLAFLIGTLIFALGFIITYSISYFEYQRISNLQEQTSYEIFKDKLDYSLFEKDLCSVDSYNEISGDLGFQGRIIDDLEKKFGKNDERVLFRKKFYSLIELEHFEFVNEMNKKCDSNISTILFFYSNDKNDIDRSEEIGKLLNVVYSRNENLVIYSFDMNLNDGLIESLKEKYNVHELFSLIIDGRTLVINPQNVDGIERFLE